MPRKEERKKALWGNALCTEILLGSQAFSSYTSLLNCRLLHLQGFFKSAIPTPNFMGEETKAQRR